MKEWQIKIIALVVISISYFLVDSRIRSFSRETREEDGSTLISCIGEVTSLDAGRADGEPPNWTWLVDGQIVTLRILGGKYKGQTAFASNTFIGEYTDRVLRRGDKLHVSINTSTGAVTLGEYVRAPFLLKLAMVFIGLVIIVSGVKGLKSVAALIISGVFIISVLIPMCLEGYNPIWVSVLISTVNTALTFVLVGGITKKSLAGMLGAVGGLLTTALLASISSRVLHLTGLDVNFGFLDLGKRLWLSKESTHWNFSRLLVSGMILGASGAIMDASMAVASAIEEVKKANPKMGALRCIISGLNVGKDEMGTMANTLIFAYIGADMTLMLMPMIQFGEAGRAMPLTRVINEESTSAEVVQAITGTMGLIMAIPITALIAGLLIGGRSEADWANSVRNILRPVFRVSDLTVPTALLIILLGVHVVYTVTRHAVAEQTGDEESQIVAEYVRAKVTDSSPPISAPSPNPLGFGPAKNEILKAKLLGGAYKGNHVLVQNILDPNRLPLYNVEVNHGDKVLLKVDGTKERIERVLMVNYTRDGFLVYLTGIFVFLMVIIGRTQGIRTAIALGISIAIVLKVLIPLIVAGYNPVVVVIGVSGVVAFLSLIIVTGFNRKAGSATIGILGGVVIASLIVLYADQKLHFTGISSSRTAIAAQFAVKSLDFRKILMAGIIMGLLGTAMDAAIGVASSVREVRRANPRMSVAQLIKAGMNVGTDLLGTMCNTLIFAYMGLRIILLMTFAGTHIFSGSKLEIVSAETISAEVLRLLAGSIGLVLTIPITAIVAASWDKVASFLGFGSRSV